MFLDAAREVLELRDDASGPSTGAPAAAAPAAAAPAAAAHPFGAYADFDLDSDKEDNGSAAHAEGGREPKRRKKIGTLQERWAMRLLRSTIMQDMDVGCGCVEECTNRLTFEEILATRTERSKEGADGPRKYLRDWLPTHRNDAKKLGYTLHARDETLTLCPAAFDILNGFGSGFTYKYIRQQGQGIVADDPNLGGHRTANATSDGIDYDSAKSMAFRGWWAELREDTEIQPNRPTEERQIDYIEPGALYVECKQDLLESGMHESAIGSYVRVLVVRAVPRPHTHAHAPPDLSWTNLWRSCAGSLASHMEARVQVHENTPTSGCRWQRQEAS